MSNLCFLICNYSGPHNEVRCHQQALEVSYTPLIFAETPLPLDKDVVLTFYFAILAYFSFSHGYLILKMVSQDQIDRVLLKKS